MSGGLRLSPGVRRILLAAAIVVLLIGAAALYVANSDLAWLRGPVSGAASRALGRELRIEGPFSLDVGRVLRISARDIVLANAPWGSAPALARVDRLVVELETRSLLHGPLRVVSLRAGGIRLDLETGPGGQRNWVLGTPRRPSATGRRRPLPRFEAVEVRGFHATLHRRADRKPLELVLERTRLREDDTGVLYLDLEGAAGGRAFRVSGRGGPLDHLAGGGELSADLQLGLEAITGHLTGRTASLSSLAEVRLDLEVSGPELADLAQLLGTPLPGSGPFEIRVNTGPGRTRDAISVEAKVGSALLEATAGGQVVPGEPPSLDLQVAASGPDARSLGSLLGVPDLPAERFTCSGRIRSRGFPVEVEAARIDVGRTGLKLHGTVGRPPDMVGTGIAFELEAPDARLLEALGSPELPGGRIGARGSLAVGDGRVTVHGLEARVGGISVEGDGVLVTGGNRSGSHVDLRASGPDLADLGPLTGGAALPSGAFELSTRLEMDDGVLRVEHLDGRLGDDRVGARGRIVPSGTLAGTELALEVEGEEPRLLGKVIGVRGLPMGPYRGRARLVVHRDSVLVQGIEATVGPNTFAGTVRLARPPATDPIDLRLEASGPDASVLEVLTGLRPLPGEPFEAAGRLLIGPGTIGFDGFSARLGETDLDLRGELRKGAGLEGSELRFGVSGKDISETGRLVGLGGLPPMAFDLAGAVGIGEDGYTLSGLRGTVEDNRLVLDGMVRPDGADTGVALDLDVSGRDLASLAAILEGLGVGGAPSWIPSRAYTFTGYVGHDAKGFTVGDLSFSIGRLEGHVDGHVGRPPHFEGTDLEVKARSEGLLETAGPGATELTIRGFRLDVRTGFIPHEPGTPGSGLVLSGGLFIDELRLEEVDPGDRPESGDPGTGSEAINTQAEEERSLFFSDDPFDLGILDSFEGGVHVEVGDLVMPLGHLQDLEVDLRLQNGGLRVDSLTARGVNGDTLMGRFDLMPVAGGYRIDLNAGIHEGSLNLSSSRIPREDWPSLDLRIEFSGEGRSLHEVMTSSDGRFSLLVGSGKVESGVLDFLGDSFVLQVVDVLNPFRKAEKTTSLECVVIAGRVEDGTVTLDPLGIRTDKVTTLGEGTIDLETEHQTIVFQSKPRRGLGLSASMVTNSLFKVGGTLSKPALELKPLSAAAMTGVAVVTAGLSVLAQGLWNRMTSNTKTCPTLREEVRELWEGGAGIRDVEKPGSEDTTRRWWEHGRRGAGERGRGETGVTNGDGAGGTDRVRGTGTDRATDRAGDRGSGGEWRPRRGPGPGTGTGEQAGGRSHHIHP